MFSDFFALFYPNLCAACDSTLLKSEVAICMQCRYTFPYIKDMRLQDNELAKKFWGRVPLKHAISLIEFHKDQTIQKVLHSVKYQSNKPAAIELGKMLAEAIQKNEQNFDSLIPVPLHQRRLKERGYNQSELIAEGMQSVLGIPIETKALKRNVYSNSQTGKGRLERWDNMETIFSLEKPDLILEQDVLLVDDVLTTGSTLEACAHALLTGPVKSVSVATVSAVV